MFIENLPLELAAAEAAGLKPNLAEYQAPNEGEEILATVTNPALLAIVAIYDQHRNEVLAKWPTPPRSPSEIAEAAGPFFELFLTHEALWDTLRENLELDPVKMPALGLRRNKGDLVVTRQTSKRRSVEAFIVSDRCNDPDCKRCNPRPFKPTPGEYRGEA